MDDNGEYDWIANHLGGGGGLEGRRREIPTGLLDQRCPFLCTFMRRKEGRKEGRIVRGGGAGNGSDVTRYLYVCVHLYIYLCIRICYVNVYVCMHMCVIDRCIGR